MPLAIRIEEISKKYRLGEIGTGTISHDLQRGLARLLGRPDPFAKVGDVNDRTAAAVLGPTRTTDYVWALRDVSFDVSQGEILGVIGRNGAGKSTLLKILSRVTSPTSGHIHAQGKIASLLEVGTGFHPELTGRENIFLNGAILGMSRHEITRQFDAIVDFSGCARYIDTPVKRYSSGMTVRLGFAVAAHLECDILVVDEVLAVGDAEFQQRCLGKMKRVSDMGRTVLFVSHNMGSVAQLCTQCAVMDHGQLGFHGDVSTAIARYLDTGNSGAVSFAANADSDFYFTAARLGDVNGCSLQAFDFTTPISLHLSYHLKHPIDGIELGVRVISSTGPIVFTTLRSHSTSSPLAVGDQSTSVHIPAGFLLPGDYTIDLGAHIPNQRLLDIEENAIGLRIEETGSPFSQYAGTRYGLVNCRCEWRDTVE